MTDHYVSISRKLSTSEPRRKHKCKTKICHVIILNLGGCACTGTVGDTLVIPYLCPEQRKDRIREGLTNSKCLILNP